MDKLKGVVPVFSGNKLAKTSDQREQRMEDSAPEGLDDHYDPRKAGVEDKDEYAISNMNDKKINLCLRLLGVRVSFVKTGYDSHGVDGHRKIKSNRFVDVKLEREYVEHIRRATSGELTIEVVCQR